MMETTMTPRVTFVRCARFLRCSAALRAVGEEAKFLRLYTASSRATSFVCEGAPSCSSAAASSFVAVPRRAARLFGMTVVSYRAAWSSAITVV